MREVVYKNMTSPKARKKDIFLREVFEKDGVHAKTERRCFYFVKKVTHLEDGSDLEGLMNSKNAENSMANKRQFHIFKEHNDSLGEDKLICKIIGTFYAVVNNNIYTVVFLHSFKVTFVKPHLT